MSLSNKITKKTLEATHQEMLNSFADRKTQKIELENKLKLLTKQIDDYNNKLKLLNNPTDRVKLTQEIWGLEDCFQNVSDQISKITSNTDEIEYLIQTSQIIKEYYAPKTAKQTGKQTAKQIAINAKHANKPKKSVLDWLSSDKEVEDKEVEDKKVDSNEIQTPVKQNKYVNLSKQQLYQKYMNVIDTNYVEDLDSDEDDLDICDMCGFEMLLQQTTGSLVCLGCGYQEQILIDSDKPSYKDPPKEVTSFCYKRINHLNECLAQFQAKETTDIPEEIYNEIFGEIKKERIKNMENITPAKLREILRKLGRAGYYEHIPYIINQLNGLPPPVISPEVEEIIRNLFKKIQDPFERNRDSTFNMKKRKNFISYSYVVYKLFELLELDEYLPRFQLLKSNYKMYQQDIIWKKICKEVRWEFIPST